MLSEIGQIDVAFVIDTTGSMGPFIEEARKHAAAEAERIATEGDLDIRFAVVEYRDHPPQDVSFVARSYPFGNGDALTRTLASLLAAGGGDTPEAVLDGLHAAANLAWREHADRLAFLIGDSPPHGCGGSDDGFPAGCPCGMTPRSIVEYLASKRVRLYAHSIAGWKVTTDVFRELAEGTGGACTEVERAMPEMVTSSYSGTLTMTSDAVAAGRAYYAAAASMPGASVAEVAHSLGWTTETAAGVKAYLSARGIATDDAVHAVKKPRRRKKP